MLEHETGLEPATPTLARESEPEEPPILTLWRAESHGEERRIAAPETADGTQTAPALGAHPHPVAGHWNHPPDPPETRKQR